jgi:hypothetical protein
MSDIEGKAVRETATERGGEGVSIMKEEMKAKLALVRRSIELRKLSESLILGLVR